MSINKTKETKLTGSKFWNPEIGQELIGKFIAMRQGKWNRDMYDIRTAEGIVTIPGSAVLKEVMTDKLLDKKVRVKFLGWGSEHQALRKEGLYRDFDVFLIEE